MVAIGILLFIAFLVSASLDMQCQEKGPFTEARTACWSLGRCWPAEPPALPCVLASCCALVRWVSVADGRVLWHGHF